MHGGAFFLPGCTIGEAEALPYYDDLPDDIRAKYRTAGSLEDWQELCRLAKRNSRMILALALQFVGPLGGLMPIEFVGVQLVGVGGTAKTAIGVAASSVWGWDPVATTADRVGFGSTWNSTVNNLERVFAGYNQTALFLDETRASSNGAGKRANEILDAIMKIERSIGKGRLTEPGSRRWFTPLLSTSNVSVVGWLKEAGLEFDAAYVDRLLDVPVPNGGSGMFEDLHDSVDVAAFSRVLKDVAAKNHGYPGRDFVRRLLKWNARDHNDLVGWIEKRRQVYIALASKKISGRGRDLTRVHGKFATVYAAGALAAKLGILTLSRRAIRIAIGRAETAHVKFLAPEFASYGLPPETGLDRLLNYLRANAKKMVKAGKGADLKKGEKVGFVGKHNGRREFLFTDETFEAIVGGKTASRKLKRDLDKRGLLARSGDKLVVKRRLDGVKRSTVVAIDMSILNSP